MKFYIFSVPILAQRKCPTGDESDTGMFWSMSFSALSHKKLLRTWKGYCCLQDAVDLPYLLQAEIDENASAGDRLRFCVPKILCDSQNSDPFWVREIVEYW